MNQEDRDVAGSLLSEKLRGSSSHLRRPRFACMLGMLEKLGMLAGHELLLLGPVTSPHGVNQMLLYLLWGREMS